MKTRRLLAAFLIAIIYFSFVPSLFFRAHAAGSPLSASAQVVLADFYWWYPWYGMQYKNPPGTGTYQPVANVNGVARQDAFTYQFTEPIPYLQSEERPEGNPDANGVLAKAWLKNNFSRAANNGIEAMAVMARPDLGKWKTALGLMVDAIKELKAEGKPYPKLVLHYDGVEYWEKTSPSAGQLTGPGRDYDAIKQGTVDSFSIVFNKIDANNQLSDFLLIDANKIPIIVYRIEGSNLPFITNNWWVTQLKQDFAALYPSYTLFMILDDLWCNHTYGIGSAIQTATCNADDYYHWGGAYDPVSTPQNATTPRIITVGPGFDESPRNSPARILDRNNGQTFTTRFQTATSMNPQWILLETFNFGEEGTAIDDTVQFGTQYLTLAKNLISAWQMASIQTPIIYLPEDLNHDHTVNIFDYNILVSEFGKTGSVADINEDGIVNIFDYNLLITNFGKNN